VVVKRRYDSTRRQEQSRQTRKAILAAAGRLFVDPGYAATPLTAVAADAGVAVQTLYAIFGSKRQLLSQLVDVTLAGDDEPVAIPERPFVAEIRALADPRAKLTRFARHLAEINSRQAQVMLALAAAATADPDAADIWRKNINERRHGMSLFAAELTATGALRPDLNLEQVTDVLWLAQDVRNFDWLVQQRRWTLEQYQHWYVNTVSGAIIS
jgi:AcrR family transcriptional regulator